MTRLLSRLKTLEPTYYDILGCAPGADSDTLHEAYLELAFALHPDHTPEEGKEEATERFKVVALAWGVLKNKDTRDNYDLRIRARLNCKPCKGTGQRGGFRNGRYERTMKCEACKGRGYSR